MTNPFNARQSGSSPRKPILRQSAGSSFSLEPLEPRVLLSADLSSMVQTIEPPVETAPSGSGNLTGNAALEHNAVAGQFWNGQDLSIQDADGTTVTFQITGAGVGRLEYGQQGWLLHISQTDRTSSVRVQTEGGDGRVRLAHATIVDPLAAFGAPTLDVTGTIRFNETIGSVTLGQLQGAALRAPGMQLLTIVGDIRGASIAIGTQSNPSANLSPPSRHGLSALYVAGAIVSTHVQVGSVENPRGLGQLWAEGGISMDSKVAAPALPRTVLIQGQSIDPLTDARFTTDMRTTHPVSPVRPAVGGSVPGDNTTPEQHTVTGQFWSGQDLALQDSDGTTVTFQMSGSGIGRAEYGRHGWSLSVSQTNATSAVRIQTDGGDGRLRLANATIVGPLAAFGAPSADLIGTIHFNETIGSVTLGQLQAGALRAPAIQLLTIVGNVQGASIAIGTEADTRTQPNVSGRHGVAALYIGGAVVSTQMQIGSGNNPRGLGQLWVVGGLSMDSKVAAATFPKTVLIQGQPVNPLEDSRFTTNMQTPAAGPPTDQVPGGLVNTPVVTPPPPAPTPPVTQPHTVSPGTSTVDGWASVLRTWEQHMLEFGSQNGEAMRRYTTYAEQVDATYYDGVRVYLEIARYTGDPGWLLYADLAKTYYRDNYVIPTQGKVPGYWNFTTGLRMDYEQTRDPRSRDAVLLLASNASFAPEGTPLAWTAGTDASREVAYALAGYVNTERLGQPHRARMDALLDQALGHLEQWFGSKTAPYVRPFMVGLTMHALIDVYEWNRDSRIPSAIERAVNGLWDRTWLSDQRAFMYTDRVAPDGSGGMEAAPDLNMLIAPAYAWMYRHTGNTLYRDRGDQIFAGAVSHAYLAHPKQFNQNYLWSFDYLNWRAQGASRA